jgi:hypothetical protein
MPDENEQGSYMATQHIPNQQLTQLQLLTSDILEDIEHQLKGEVYNEEKDKYEQKGMRLVLTDEGVKACLTQLYTFLNRNVILTELKETNIRIIMQVLDEEITWFLAEHGDTFTNNDVSKLDLIKRILTHTAYFTMNRALERGEGKLLGQTTTHVEHYEQAQGSVLSKISPFGKGK